MYRNFAFFISILFLTLSCNNNDPEPENDTLYNHGVFIVNEGNFTESDGSLSFWDSDSSKIHNKVFESANDRPFAGLMQSAAFFEDRGYLIDQNGRIEVIDRQTLAGLHTISAQLSIPRYIAFHGSKGFVSDWGPYDVNYGNPDSRIKVFDLNNYELIKEFDTPSKPEGLLIIDDALYVANSGSNTVSVYNVNDYSLFKTIGVNNGPIQFVVDAEMNIWVVSNGAYVSGGALQKISTSVNMVVKTVDLSAVYPNGRIGIDGSAHTIFLIGETWAPDYSYTETNVYSINITQPDSYSSIISGRNFYGIGVDPKNSMLYVSNNEAFQGNGMVYRYNFSGEKSDEFNVGRGPREFVFMN